LLERYKEAALEKDYFEKLKRAARVFEDMLAKASRYMPSKGIAFTNVMEIPEARHAFETAYKYSTTVPLDLQRLKQIKDIPCLILWGKNDALIPPSHVDIFEKIFDKKEKCMIDDSDSPHAEKPTITYEKIKSFLK
jgi:pimeloyl-ACP methyl ester carboxylesterase